MSKEVQPQEKEIKSPWLTAEEAYRYLGLPSVKALYERVRRGQFPVQRLARSLRFYREELDRALLEGGRDAQVTVDSVLRRLSAGKKGGK